MNQKRLLEIKKKGAILGSTLLMLTSLSACTTLSNLNDVNSDKSAQTSSKELDDNYAYLVIFNGSQATYVKIVDPDVSYSFYVGYKTDGAEIYFRESHYELNAYYAIVRGPKAEEVAKKMVEDLDYSGPTLSK